MAIVVLIFKRRCIWSIRLGYGIRQGIRGRNKLAKDTIIEMAVAVGNMSRMRQVLHALQADWRCHMVLADMQRCHALHQQEHKQQHPCHTSAICFPIFH